MPHYNASMTSFDVSAGSVNFPVWQLSLFVLCVVALAFLILLISQPLYNFLRKRLRWLKGSFEYFIYGLSGTAVLGIFYLIIAYFVGSAKQGNYTPFKVALYPIGFYIVVCLFGIVVKYLVQIFRKREDNYNKVEIDKLLKKKK